MSNWNGQDDDIQMIADQHNAYICKRRRSYCYCTFLSSNDRTAFKAAVVAANIPNVTMKDISLESNPNYFIVKTEPV